MHLDWDPRIPAVQFGNWPDAVYHSSDDSPANQDPTQMKRAAFLMVTVGSTFASAGPADAVAISQVALGYAQQRIASDLGNALLPLSTSTTDTLRPDYKEALNVVSQAYARERADLGSATTLAAGDKDAAASIASFEQALGQSEPLDIARVKMSLQGRGGPAEGSRRSKRRRSPTRNKQPHGDPVEKARCRAQPFGPAHCAGRGAAAAARVLRDGGPELRRRHALDPRHQERDRRRVGPVALSNVVQFFRDAEKAGTFTIAEKPAEPAGKRKAKKSKSGYLVRRGTPPSPAGKPKSASRRPIPPRSTRCDVCCFLYWPEWRWGLPWPGPRDPPPLTRATCRSGGSFSRKAELDSSSTSGG